MRVAALLRTVANLVAVEAVNPLDLPTLPIHLVLPVRGAPEPPAASPDGGGLLQAELHGLQQLDDGARSPFKHCLGTSPLGSFAPCLGKAEAALAGLPRHRRNQHEDMMAALWTGVAVCHCSPLYRILLGDLLNTRTMNPEMSVDEVVKTAHARFMDQFAADFAPHGPEVAAVRPPTVADLIALHAAAEGGRASSQGAVAFYAAAVRAGVATDARAGVRAPTADADGDAPPYSAARGALRTVWEFVRRRPPLTPSVPAQLGGSAERAAW
eukprot:gene55318-12421_t